jgi:glycosyltransferase involved in cell wall biosynthesis
MGIGSMQPKISVITVCFNCEASIEDSILSVKNQDYKNFEHIIIDGASTDKTLDVIKALKHDKLKVFSAPDRGIYDAMNKGLKKVSGDIVAFLNADDWYATADILSTVAKKYSKGLDYLYGNLSFVSGKEKKIIRIWLAKPNNLDKRFPQLMPPFPTMFFNVKIFKEEGLRFDISYRISGDYDFCLRLHQHKTIRSTHLNQNMVFMRYGGASTDGPLAIYKSNREVLRSLYQIDQIKVWFTFFLKIVFKLTQFHLKESYASYFWPTLPSQVKPIKLERQLPSVAILLCSLNGENYLRDQLNSIASQSYTAWKLYVSDDGSTDKTLDILQDYQKAWGKEKLQIIKGPGQGFQKNFISLIANKKIHADFYVLSDQDDVWLSNKISRAISHLKNEDLNISQLYCGRSTYVSKNLRLIKESQLFNKPPSFRNAIIQSIAGGNTMAFNQKLKETVMLFTHVDVVSHDWWLYILCELSGGRTYYDPTSFILYRQHESSLIGENISLKAKLRRFFIVLKGGFRNYNDKHLEGLHAVSLAFGSPKNIHIIDSFYHDRDKGVWARFQMIRNLGLYRQTWGDQMALYLSAILHKL